MGMRKVISNLLNTDFIHGIFNAILVRMWIIHPYFSWSLHLYDCPFAGEVILQHANKKQGPDSIYKE